MKSHPHLLLRDALAEQFVRAARGDPAARRVVEALARWGAERTPSPLLEGLAAETGEPLFDGAALAERFAPLEAWARDRARRFAAACGWIEEAGTHDDPIECARAAWDAGLFFEVHELIEPVWLEERGPTRPLLQGLILAGAALHHLVGGNTAGATGLLRDAARHLEAPAPDAAWAFADFGRALGELGEAVREGRIVHADDIEELPRLENRTDR